MKPYVDATYCCVAVLCHICGYCGVKFSSSSTLQAHLTFYCSKKPAPGTTVAPPAGLMSTTSDSCTAENGASGESLLSLVSRKQVCMLILFMNTSKSHLCVCVHACVYVRACTCVCTCVCVRACVYVCLFGFSLYLFGFFVYFFYLLVSFLPAHRCKWASVKVCVHACM